MYSGGIMEPYYVFAGDTYYPNVGLKDYRGKIYVDNSEESVYEAAAKEFPDADWYEIYSQEQLESLFGITLSDTIPETDEEE